MNILIYEGKSKYSAFENFIYGLYENLKINHEVYKYNFGTDNNINALIELLSQVKFDLIIGINGLGADLNVENQSVYDLLDTTYYALFVDHPVYHMNTLNLDIKKYIVSFVDKSHIIYVENILKDKHQMKFFLPHGCIEKEKEIKDFDEYKKIKDIDILFAGSNFEVSNESIFETKILPTSYLKSIANLLLEDEYMTLPKAIALTFKDTELKLSTKQEYNNSSIYMAIFNYVRAIKRQKLINALLESGLNIKVYGDKSWEEKVKSHSNIQYLGEINTNDLQKSIKRAKIFINANSIHTMGSHERLFEGMINKAVVFSDRSYYYDEVFKEDEELFFYNYNTLDLDFQKIKDCIKNDDKLYEMATKSYEKVKNSHTWQKRVEVIEQMYNYNMFLNNVKYD